MDNSLKTHVFTFEMGGCDIVLGTEWLRTFRAHHHGFPIVIHEFSEDDAFLYTQSSQSSLSRNRQLPSYGKAS
jgi:hypothetical protein